MIMKNVASAYIERWNFVLGAIFVAIVVFMPEGLVPGTVRLARWTASAWRAMRAAAAGAGLTVRGRGAHIRDNSAMAIRAQEPVADRAGTVSVGGVEVRPRRRSRHAAPARPAWPTRSSSPTLLIILFLVAYPFCAAIWLSLQDKMVGSPGRLVLLDQDYLELFRDEVFLRTAWNSIIHTAVSVAIKFVLGLTMALVLDLERRWNNVFRTLLFVPWAVPVGDPPPELALDLRRPQRPAQQLPDHLRPQQQHHLLALQPESGHGLRDRGGGVGGHALLRHDLPGRAPVDTRASCTRRRRSTARP